MKKLKTFTLLLVTMILLVFSGVQTIAQVQPEPAPAGGPQQSQGGVGGVLGIVYGFDIEEPGLRFGITNFLNENMRVGGDITYWLIGDETFFGETISFNYLEINGHFHYLFFQQDELIIYGIGALGLHYARVKFMDESDSDSEIGLGFGAGAEYNLGNISVFAEPKLFLTGFDQLKFTAGIRYYFN